MGKLYKNMALKAFLPIPVVLTTLSSLLTPVAFANMNGNATQSFNPAVGGQEFATVHSSSTVPKNNFNLGLFSDAAKNSLPYQDQRNASAPNYVSVVHLLTGYGVTTWAEVGLAAPFVVGQDISGDETHSEFFAQGNTEIKPWIKAAVFRNSKFGLALQGNFNINRLQDDPYAGQGSNSSQSLETAIDLTFGGMKIAANVGYLNQKKGRPVEGSLIEPIGSRLIYSGGLRQKIGMSQAYVIGEVFASSPLDSIKGNATDREVNQLESLLGFQYFTDSRTRYQMGATKELEHGLNTPDLRLYLGVNQLIGPSKSAPTPKRRTVIAAEKPIDDFKVSERDEPISYKEPIPVANEPEQILPTEVPTQAPAAVFVLRDVNFRFDSDYSILPGGLKELNKVSRHLSNNSYDLIVVEGHCDYYGDDQYNDELSMRRAKNVARHFVKYEGIPFERIKFVGFGEKRPKSTDASDLGRQVNRRVEIKIYRGGNLEVSSTH
jgi:outer membrane protein OmpA-like peptidoglycan-associated protein